MTDTTNEITQLRERLAALEATAAQRLTPEQREAMERKARADEIDRAIAERFPGPVRYVDPLAGHYRADATVIRERPAVVREDLGWGYVYR